MGSIVFAGHGGFGLFAHAVLYGNGDHGDDWGGAVAGMAGRSVFAI